MAVVNDSCVFALLSKAECELIEFIRKVRSGRIAVEISAFGYVVRAAVAQARGDFAELAGVGYVRGQGRTFSAALADLAIETLQSQASPLLINLSDLEVDQHQPKRDAYSDPSRDPNRGGHRVAITPESRDQKEDDDGDARARGHASVSIIRLATFEGRVV